MGRLVPDPDRIGRGSGDVGGSGLGFQGLWDKGVGGLVRPVGPFGLAGRQLGRSPVGGLLSLFFSFVSFVFCFFLYFAFF